MLWPLSSLVDASIGFLFCHEDHERSDRIRCVSSSLPGGMHVLSNISKGQVSCRSVCSTFASAARNAFCLGNKAGGKFLVWIRACLKAGDAIIHGTFEKGKS